MSNLLNRRQFLSLSTATTALLLCPMHTYADITHDIKGRVFVNGKIIDKQTVIQAGDLIETKNQSQLIFKLHDDAYKIKPNSKVKIHSASANGDGLLEILGGAMLAVFGKSNKQIKTPVATMGIRGTGIYVHVDDKNSYFCTCFGKTDLVSNKEKMQLNATIMPHKAKNIGQDLKIIAGNMHGHEDWELVELANIAGIALPNIFMR